MIVTKTFKGKDGKFRQWNWDNNTKTIIYKGYAKDFKNPELINDDKKVVDNLFTVNINLQSASELIESVCKEEGLSMHNVK